MKFQLASGLLLGAVAVDAFKPAEYSYDSSAYETNEGSVSGEIQWQSPPTNSTLIPKHLDEDDDSENRWQAWCSSEQKNGKCQYAIDGRADRYWQSSQSEAEPAWIIVDLKQEYNVSGLTMLPRIGKEITRGQIADHRIYLSKDNQTWGEEIAYGNWGANQGMKLSSFDPVPARFIKLVADTESHPNRTQTKNGLVSIANLSVYHTKYILPALPGKGAWGPTIDLPVVPVAAAVDQRGDLIMWSAWADDQFFASPGGKTLTTTLEKNGNISQTVVADTDHDMFCPGISMDFNGNIVVTGGADSGRTSLYDGQEWKRLPNMKTARGYQASTTLSDGRIFLIGGSWSGGNKIEKNGEVLSFTPNGDYTWERRSGAKVDPMLTHDRLGRWRADNHGWLFGWKNESVFQAGPSKAMHWYDVDWKDYKGRVKGDVRFAGNRSNDHDSMSGNAVMYDAVKGKILTFGGQRHYDGSYGSFNAHLITLGETYEEPLVQVAGNGSGGGMNFARVFHTSVVLPDGKVFTAGGQVWGKPFNETNVQFTPEIYDPDTDTFVPQNSNNLVRVYHSISMLLPDATVLNGGGGLCGNCSANHYDAQIFTPPYLLTPSGEKAPRPEILDAPDRAVVGDEIQFMTDSMIASASLVRIGSTTHTVNTDQRRVPLEIECRGDNIYTSNLPEDAGILLPGWYMLFVMNAHGTPSIASMVKIELGQYARMEYVHSSAEDNEEEEEMEVELGSEFPEEVQDCDHDEEMTEDEEEQVKGMISVIFASPSKFWKSWKSSLVSQA